MISNLSIGLPVELVGRKGFNLSKIQQSGYRVPSTYVVSTKAFMYFLKENKLWERAVAGGDSTLSEAIYRAEMPQRLVKLVGESLKKLGATVALRSSAVDEDGRHQSFAGQYESYLHITDLHGALDSIKKCWASYFSSRVRLYRGSRCKYPSGMAVLIQNQLKPDHAGVCFTINPISGSWKEMVIEAKQGLGDKVVDGSIVPDYYRISRPTRLSPIGLRFQLKKSRQIIERSCPSGKGLSESQLQKLVRTALKLERSSNKPQDIEWAIENQKVFILQGRPITSEFQPMKEEALWSRAFVGERWSTPATPLGWSIMSDNLNYFIEYPNVSRRFLGSEPSLMSHRYSPYINLSIFRHLLFKWPGSPPPQFMLELLPPSEALMWVNRFAVAPNMALYSSILKETIRESRWKRFRWNPFSNWLIWEEFSKELALISQQSLTAKMSAKELWMQHKYFNSVAKKYIGIHICSLLFANIGYECCAYLLRRYLKADEPSQILRSNRTTPTTQMNQKLWSLANGYCSKEDFLSVYGIRSTNSWELFAPRWSESPKLLDPLLDLFKGQAEPLEIERESLVQAHALMRKLPLWLQLMVRQTQQYLYLREAQRFSFDNFLWAWKQILCQLEHKTGKELRWLTQLEVEGYLTGESFKLDEIIKKRRGEWEAEQHRWRGGDSPPYLLSETIMTAKEGSRLQGMGISPGVVKAKARVLHSLDDASQLKPGEILVVRSTDPAWTPLFWPASGIILELGGMLSHGAIVARECRTPAVSGIPNVTKIIKTGQSIQMDGRRGWVFLDV